MEIKLTVDPVRYARMNTAELRGSFLVETLFTPGRLALVYSDMDRAVIGSAMPGDAPLTLPVPAELRAQFFCERRELGILNIGAPGTVTLDGKSYALATRDCLYVSRGSKEVTFAGANAAFYLLSYPAHVAHPTTLARQADASPVVLGSPAEANQRTIYKYVHAGGVQSCQLAMGLTQLAPGSVWNTMPPHTHTRRSEVYVYFDLAENARVVHLMGQPTETRNLMVANRQVVISPIWSIHCGCGTGPYAFCWGMGGENQDFNDMDPAPLAQLR